MAWPPDGEKILKICLFVLTESTNVTDRQTDKHHMTARSRLMLASCGKKLKTPGSAAPDDILTLIVHTRNKREH